METKSDWSKDIKPFVCRGCGEVFSKPEHFSREPKLCLYCYKERQAVKNNKCLSCGGKNPKLENWGCCDKCFFKKRSKKEDEIDCDEAQMLEELEEKKGWEAVQDYLDNKRKGGENK